VTTTYHFHSLLQKRKSQRRKNQVLPSKKTTFSKKEKDNDTKGKCYRARKRLPSSIPSVKKAKVNDAKGKCYRARNGGGTQNYRTQTNRYAAYFRHFTVTNIVSNFTTSTVDFSSNSNSTKLSMDVTNRLSESG